jgi:hypothetical protein
VPRRNDLDHKHSRAIAKAIAEKLREALKPEPDQPERLKAQIERLRKLEQRAP